MVTQQRELEARLEREGWRLIAKEPGDDWWADEIWTIASTWHPQGIQLWLTFLVDPQHDGPRRRGEHVWAIRLSSTRPQDVDDIPLSSVAMRGHWAEALEELAEAVARQRGRVTAGDRAG